MICGIWNFMVYALISLGILLTESEKLELMRSIASESSSKRLAIVRIIFSAVFGVTCLMDVESLTIMVFL
jgi:hypothetical protein